MIRGTLKTLTIALQLMAMPALAETPVWPGCQTDMECETMAARECEKGNRDACAMLESDEPESDECETDECEECRECNDRA